MTASDFKFVSYKWDHNHAASLQSDQVALLLYRSNLLGSDLRITNFGGGNTSCKNFETDPLTGSPVKVMWIKGSGGDLGTMKRSGLAGLYHQRLIALRDVYKGIEHEDEMVDLFNHCIYDLKSKPPSIDTPLHAFLPFNHVDHLHPDAAIAIAASKDGKQITKELFQGTIGWVSWQRPGFDLGLKLSECFSENPEIRGIMLGSHGLFTWGDTAYDCYLNSLSVIEKCALFLESGYGKRRPVFGGVSIDSPDSKVRGQIATSLAPILRHFCSTGKRMIGHFSDAPDVLEFINSNDLEKLAPMGTSCPDHFLRTKISPLVLKLNVDADLNDSDTLKKIIAPQFEGYRSMYSAYYQSCRQTDSPDMRDPNPVIILLPGTVMFSFAADKQTARVASEFYINAIHVMKGAEAVSEYTSLPRQEAFNIEYWKLEEAKLKRMPVPRPLAGRVALVTGSGGGIGKAIARKFASEGACVILSDHDETRLSAATDEFKRDFGDDAFTAFKMDVTNPEMIEATLMNAVLRFGGIDLVVNNAGLSISGPVDEHREKDWDLLFDVLVKGQFLVSSAAIRIMKKQSMGGDIINIVSKNAVVAGPNNAGYGSAKAAQLHMTRLMAAELGSHRIRINAVNPDAVIAESKIWEGAWAEGRAKAYGIKVEDLPGFYAGRTLLNEVILPEDIANACYLLVSGLLNKSTGNVLNVDGGIASAFMR
ncbi:MAG: bifunctional aldolase/short-chain dehydrogenase [Cyclobacteriaceae bacterium]